MKFITIGEYSRNGSLMKPRRRPSEEEVDAEWYKPESRPIAKESAHNTS